MFRPVSDPNMPFRRVLWLASDKLYLHHVDLSVPLDSDPQGTLFAISASPTTFGDIRPALGVAQLQTAHQRLITAAKAYIVHARKHAAHAVDQGELALDVDVAD